MNAVEEAHQHEVSTSGLCTRGERLFADNRLQDVLVARSAAQVDDALPHALMAEPFSGLQVRRHLTQAAMIDCPIELQSTDLSASVSRQDKAFVLHLPFAGDGTLFKASTETPASRPLRGRIDGKHLILTVRSEECDFAIVPYAMVSEVVAIGQVLAEQRAMIADHNHLQVDACRMLVKEHWQMFRDKRSAALKAHKTGAEENRRALLEQYDQLTKRPGVTQLAAALKLI